MAKKTLSLAMLLASAMTLTSQPRTAELVDVQEYVPDIILDLHYATARNPTRSVITHNTGCYLHKEAAESLCAVQKELAQFGLGLKVFEAYRAQSDHAHYRSIAGDEADEPLPARHQTAMSVDVTLVDLDGLDEVQMPTAYDDDNNDACTRNYSELTEETFNAILLEEVMQEHGWEPAPEAWWHFDYRGWQDFEELDVQP